MPRTSRRLRWFPRRRVELERELDEELAYHLEMVIEQNLRRGMGPEEARTAALRSFGGVERVKEECREERRGSFLETLWQDLRYGARTLRRNPGYAAVVVLTLALGIGANTAVFSAVHGVLLSPLPYAGGERLVLVRQSAPLAGIDDLGFSVPEVRDYQSQSRTLAGAVEYHSMLFTLLGRAEPMRVRTGVVSPEFFSVLGTEPLLGRTFLPADDDHGAAPVLVLSHGFWRRELGSDPGIVGRTFEMNDRVHTVVGVLPPLPPYPDENDVYMPASSCPSAATASTTATPAWVSCSPGCATG